jgi:N-acetylglucosaminyl-diphospho-decaprenol L-rhamnosyltransferase
VSEATGPKPQRSGRSVAAVVVNYNAASALCDCVESLEASGVTEIVVVDNASTDDSMALLAKCSPNVRLVSSPDNLGFGRGANLGARFTAAEYLLVCNPDLVVKPDAVQRLATALDESPAVALAGPMLREPSGLVYPSGREFPGMAEAVGHGFIGLFWGGNPWTQRYRRIGQEQHRSRDADWVSGAVFLVKRKAFDQVGGFDERYFMFVEDVDLCWRLRKAGWRIRYVAEAEVVHQQGLSTARHPYLMLVEHHRSMWRFARQTASGADRALLPVVAIGLGIRLVLAWAEHLASPRSRLRRHPG